MRITVAVSALAAASSAIVFPNPRLFGKPEMRTQRAISWTRETFEYISHCMQTATGYSKETLEEIFGAEERQLEGSDDHHHLPPPPPPPPHHAHPPPRKPGDPHKPGPSKPGGPGEKPGKKPGNGGGHGGHGGDGGHGGNGGSGGKNPGYPGDGSQPGYPGSHEQPYLPPNSTNSTVWDLISNGKYTTKFYKLASKYENVIQILNNTNTNITVFIPTDDNFYFPGGDDDGDKKNSSSGDDDDNKNGPPSEVIEDTLLYHITWGRHKAADLTHRQTLASAYNEAGLGGRPQKLRTHVGLFGGIRVNFFGRVMGADIRAENGVVHVINAPLFPPPPADKIISLTSGRFGRFASALNQTDFVSYFQDLALNGITIFAPTNDAFDRMGSKTNEFLFQSGERKNRRYLKALLKYHIAANNTLYSDAFYQERHGGGGHKERKGSSSAGHQFVISNGKPDERRRDVRVSLPTLLGKSNVSVAINNLGGWRRLTVDGYAPVTVADVVSKEGVIHVVARVLVPPEKSSSAIESEEDGDEISVEELKERLDDYLDEDDECTAEEWDYDL